LTQLKCSPENPGRFRTPYGPVLDFQQLYYFTPETFNASNVVGLIQHFKDNCLVVGELEILFRLKGNDLIVSKSLESAFTKIRHKTFLHFSKKLEGYPETEKLKQTDLTNNQLISVQHILSDLKQYPAHELLDLYKNERLLVQFIDGVPTSCLHWQKISTDVIEIVTMATSLQDRRKGLGTAILNQFFSFASSKFTEVSLKVEVNNLSAIKLYEKCGFCNIEEKSEKWCYVTFSEKSV
jgi:ribosomal protein S18 acetylase RimI-like enzyme